MHELNTQIHARIRAKIWAECTKYSNKSAQNLGKISAKSTQDPCSFPVVMLSLATFSAYNFPKQQTSSKMISAKPKPEAFGQRLWTREENRSQRIKRGGSSGTCFAKVSRRGGHTLPIPLLEEVKTENNLCASRDSNFTIFSALRAKGI